MVQAVLIFPGLLDCQPPCWHHDDMSCTLLQLARLCSCCARRRWLLGLLVLQSMSSFVLDSYQELLREHLVVTLFLTMLVGAGGNAGNQSAIKVIRGLVRPRPSSACAPAPACSMVKGLGGLGCAITWTDFCCTSASRHAKDVVLHAGPGALALIQ